MLTLKSNDNQEFLVEESVAAQSLTIKNLLDDVESTVIPLPNVDAKTLTHVIEYLKKHADYSQPEDNDNETDKEKNNDDDLKKFDDEFVDKELSILFDIIVAANFLNIKGLMEVSCQKVADVMKTKSVEWVRNTFGIENDYTPEEEEKIRNEYAWAFEGVDED